MSVELWKSSLLTMPDDSFFEIIHSALGKIKTPFNKQNLLKDLETFLRRKNIQQAIASFIDAKDAKILTAIALFGSPTQKELEDFFFGEFSLMRLNDIIVNLEERFVLYRFKDSDYKPVHQFRLAINPVLEKVLAPFTEDIKILFPADFAQPADAAHSTGAGKSKKNTIKINDLIIAGLLSFVLQMEGQQFYKKEGQLRKQIIDAGNLCFPGLDLEESFGALQVLGLFNGNGECLTPDKNRFADFALLSARERMEYCAAALLVFKESVQSTQEIQASYYKNRVKEAFNFIHALIDSLVLIYKSPEKEMDFPETSIIRLIKVLKSKKEYIVNEKELINYLIKTGLIINTTGSLYNINCTLYTVHCKLPSVTIDSGFSIFVHPEINFSDAIELASFLNIKEAGAVMRFELEKDSAVRAFNNGIPARHIIDTLNRLSANKESGKKAPEPLVWNLNDWEKRYKEVSLKRGTVLTLSKEKQYLAQTMPLSALILETLAPGVYLLSEDAEEEAASALRNSGIDIIARKKNPHTPQTHEEKRKKHSMVQSHGYYASSVAREEIFPKTCALKTGKKKGSGFLQTETQTDALELKKDFYKILEKIPLDKTDRDILSSRIERKLILCESQLKEASIRYEKLEARNIDYTGKLIIAKQAIAQNAPVEIIFGKKQMYGTLHALEKEGDNCFLVITPDNEGALHGNALHGNEEIRIPLAKISLIRRIKKSIFEN